MITVAGTPPQKRQKGGVSGTGNLLKEIIMKFSLVNSFNVLPAPALVVSLKHYTPTTSLDGLSEFSLKFFILPTL